MNRKEEAADGLCRHAESDHSKNDGTGKRREIAELAGPEGEAHIAGMPPCQPVGARRKPECADMRRHMYAVGEQRHGAEEAPRCNLDAHACRREKHRGAGAELRMLVAV